MHRVRQNRCAPALRLREENNAERTDDITPPRQHFGMDDGSCSEYKKGLARGWEMFHKWRASNAAALRARVDDACCRPMASQLQPRRTNALFGTAQLLPHGHQHGLRRPNRRWHEGRTLPATSQHCTGVPRNPTAQPASRRVRGLDTEKLPLQSMLAARPTPGSVTGRAPIQNADTVDILESQTTSEGGEAARVEDQCSTVRELEVD